jgi:hypothetical protein
MKYFVLLALFLFSSNGFCQNQKETDFHKQVRKQMQRHQELFDSFMTDDFGSIEKKFQKIFKEMGQDDFFGEDDFGKLFKGRLGHFNRPKFAKFEWKDYPRKKVLILIIPNSKDKAIDLKVEKGFVKISAKTKGKSKVSKSEKIEQQISIPGGLNQKTPIFKNVGKNFHIEFSKLYPGKKRDSTGLTPIKKRPTDIAI